VTDVTKDSQVEDLPVRCPAWIAHVLDESTGEPHAVLLHLPRGERVALSPTATRVWQLIVAGGPAGASKADVVPLLASEYGADPLIIDRDVTALMEQLTTGEWVERVASSERPTGDASGGADS
jgi:hypothetical protein